MKKSFKNYSLACLLGVCLFQCSLQYVGAKGGDRWFHFTNVVDTGYTTNVYVLSIYDLVSPPATIDWNYPVHAIGEHNAFGGWVNVSAAQRAYSSTWKPPVGATWEPSPYIESYPADDNPQGWCAVYGCTPIPGPGDAVFGVYTDSYDIAFTNNTTEQPDYAYYVKAAHPPTQAGAKYRNGDSASPVYNRDDFVYVDPNW